MRKLLCVVPALLLASCHSQQVAFQFQPVPSSVAMAPAPAPAESMALPRAEATVLPAATASPAKPAKRLRPRQVAAALKALPPTTLATLATTTLAQRPRPQHLTLGRRHTTEGAAESGLGGIGLFVIGVVLALLAGLGTLAALIPGVSFLGGVGLAAAALVVLFLLYSLVSGGKKKATPPAK
jgi:hypothetical protein